MAGNTIATTLAELPRVAAYAGPGAEFYVKEITTLDKWRHGVPHLPHNRVWCGLNSFNMGGEGRALLSLQGAGDLMMLSQFIHDVGGVDYVTAYTDRVGILGKGINTLPITRRGPTDMRLGQIRHEYAYVSNHPAALQFLMREAVESGWDHYDWFGLMLGIVPKEKWVYVEWEDWDFPVPDHPFVAIHAHASTSDRSVPMLEELSVHSDIPCVVLGSGRSYHESYRILQRAFAVIAVDSVVLHMAVVARPDLPVLGLYTSTPTTWRGPDRPGVDRIHVDKTNLKEILLWTRKRLGMQK